MSRSYLTDYLGRDVNTDAGALEAVDAACELVRTHAGQTFNLVAGDVVTLDGKGTDLLLLPQLPVTKAGTVTVDGGTVSGYTVGSKTGVLYRGSAAVWPEGRQNVSVTYDHGYADEDLPRDVRMVALGVAARIIVQGQAQQETLGDVSIRYWQPSFDLTPGEKQTLRRYRVGW